MGRLGDNQWVTRPRSRQAYLGVDLGTSGLKLTLLADTGSIVAEAEASYDVRSAQRGYAETDPEEWASALFQAASGLEAEVGEAAAASTGESMGVAGIGVTGQMHGLVLADEHGHPVRPALLWPDQRAAEMLATWQAMAPDARARLANPLVAGMAGPMLSWLRRHEPASLEAMTVACSPKDWLRGQLTGDRVTERSDASATLLWDVVADDWSSAALTLARVGRDKLPTLVGSDEVVGTTRWPLARRADGGNAPGDVRVVAGGADTACALAALKATQPAARWPRCLVVNVGTGIQLLRPKAVSQARLEPVTHLYGDTDAGTYEMAAIQNGGLALSWVQGALGLSWDDLVATARGASPGAQGVSFLPFLTGERGAVASPGSTAGWFNLTSSVGRAEMARAAFEALAFLVRRGLQVMGVDDDEIVLSGGGARDPWVRQLIVDVAGRPMRHVHLRSASAVGAAMLAARGVGAVLPVPATVVDVHPVGDPALDAAYTRWLERVDS